jgi:hypothetical protein
MMVGEVVIPMPQFYAPIESPSERKNIEKFLLFIIFVLAMIDLTLLSFMCIYLFF